MAEETAKVAIISDTHSYLDERIAQIIRDCDYAIHAGDIGSGHILEQMQPRTAKVAVAGNNDHAAAWPEAEHAVVSELPHIAELVLPGGKIAIEHGHRHGHHKPCHDALRAAHPDARVVVYGHTHKLVCDRSEEKWVINPGAAGLTRNHGGPSCLVLTAADGAWELEPIRFSDAEEAITA